MAKTPQQWYDILAAEKETFSSLDTLVPNPDENQTFLDDLTSTSTVGKWRLMLWIFAVGASMLETLFDLFKADVEALEEDLLYGTLPWYVRESKLFQFGDTLQIDDDGNIFYNVVDESKQIIKLASASEIGRTVRLKVAKFDVDGVTPIPLTTDELNAYNTYIEQIRPVGVDTSPASLPADDLRLTDLEVYYDPLVLAADGSLLSDSGVFPVEDAITNHIRNLPFDGVLNLTALVDEIQTAEGVIDPVLNEAQARSGAQPFAVIDDNYDTASGYMEFDDAGSTITYIAAT